MVLLVPASEGAIACFLSNYFKKSEGRKWGVGSVVIEFGVFGGAPIFRPEVPNPLKQVLDGNRGAPKTPIQPRRIQPPIHGPLKKGFRPGKFPKITVFF